MIFIVTGTHHLPFNFLLELVNSLDISEKVIVQSGTSKTNINESITQSYFSYEDFIKNIIQARCVITHAGPAAIFQILKYNKNLPIVVPRRWERGEHVSNHQVHFADYLIRKKKILMVESKIEMMQAITKPKLNLNNSGLTNTDLGKLVSNLGDFLKKFENGIDQSLLKNDK